MLEAVKQMAREAGKILLKYHHGSYKTEFKENDKLNPVTSADLEADAFLRKRLREEFPDDKLLSEENDTLPDDYSGRVWMIDPLDGTIEFVNGTKSFAVVIGLCVDGIPMLGVVFRPAHDELLFAEKGKGAFLETKEGIRKIETSEVSQLSKANLLLRKSRRWGRPLEKAVEALKVGKRINEGGYATKSCRIAKGEGDLYIHTSYHLSKWDTCGTQVILEEAGGKVTDTLGNPLDYAQTSTKWKYAAVASNGLIHPEVIRHLAGMTTPK